MRNFYFSFISTFLLFSCTPNPCKDVPCVNGECLEGSCFCDEWYEGNNCDTLTTAKYLGTYQGPVDFIDYDGSLLTGGSGGGQLIEGDTINTLLFSWAFKHRMVFQTDDNGSFTMPDTTVDNFIFWGHGVVTSDSLFVTQYQQDTVSLETATTICSWEKY